LIAQQILVVHTGVNDVVTKIRIHFNQDF